MNKTLHVVALNIPWPANYGGVIDIYYKVKALHECGVKIILHCFEYERPHAAELEAICKEVHYYRRRTGWQTNISLLPYNVYSRKDERLLRNLRKDDYPILFEGLHTCYYLTDPELADRIKIFRGCNIEHDYYHAIGQAEHHPLKKLFYHVEAERFRRFEQKVEDAQIMLAVSMKDCTYLRKTFPKNHVEFMPCFHAYNAITSKEGQSGILLYHAKLSVKENETAALYLIRNVFGKLSPFRCIIAGMNPSRRLLKEAARYPNISVEANPVAERIDQLIGEAHIHLLVTFQDTGLKLKLLNSLFAGRHVVVNPPMLAGSGLDELCHIAETPEQMIATCRRLMKQPFTASEIERRKQLLFPTYSNRYQAEQLVRMIYEDCDTVSPPPSTYTFLQSRPEDSSR